MNEREPTRDELLAMAYVDGELRDDAREEFERRLAGEPALRREVSALKKLELLARSAAPKEPMDHEWDALARDPVQRSALTLGWVLSVLGTLGMGGFVLYLLFSAEIPLLLKLFLGALIAGSAALFLATLRARLRMLPHDPYTEVKR